MPIVDQLLLTPAMIPLLTYARALSIISPTQSGLPILRCTERTKLRLIVAVPAVHRPVPHFRSAIEAHLPALEMSIPL